METSEGLKTLLLPALDLPTRFSVPARSFYSVRSTGGLTQELHWVVQDPGAIARDRNLNVILPNGLADPLGMEFLKL